MQSGRKKFFDSEKWAEVQQMSEFDLSHVDRNSDYDSEHTASPA